MTPLTVRQPLVWMAVLVFAAATTLTLQGWVGGATVYADQTEQRRLDAHASRLTNTPPPGGWAATGSNGTNIRVVAVHLAEQIHRVTGVSVLAAYKLIDTGCLFASIVLVFAFLSRWLTPTYGMLGILLYAAMLPLTYFLYFGHPWDRLSIVMWLLLLLLIQADAFWVMLPLLALSVAVKYDIVLLPTLYWLVWANADRWKVVTVRTAALFAVSFGTYWGLRILIPGGFAPSDTIAQVMTNLQTAMDMHLLYPPLLAFGPIALLVALGWRHADRMARAHALFGALLLVPFFLGSNFAEVRAEVPVWVLAAPVALIGLKHLLERGASGESGSPAAVSRAGVG